MITCSICETATVADVEEAIKNDWHPNWFKGEEQQPPCCGACGQFLRLADDGEAELIPELQESK